MLKFIILLLSVFNINSQDRFPVYVGVGYDIAFGNPLTDRVDPGFRGHIFTLTYSEGKRLGNFLVPDKMLGRLRSSCSYSASVSEFRGTTSYQNDLRASVEMSASTSFFMVQTSFSASTEFQRMTETATENQQTVMNSGARCEAYDLSMDRFNLPDISRGFRNAINMVAKDPSIWNDIFQQFGSHYVRTAIFGGRMTLQQSLKRSSVQQLVSMGLDISTTAGMSFARFSGDSSVSVGAHENEINAFENRLEETRELYIGGRPPESGNWIDWYVDVLEAPMPTSYSINSLSELITSTNFPELSSAALAKLRSEFDTSLEAYCRQRGCQHPSGDLSRPPPVRVSIRRFNTVLFLGPGCTNCVRVEDPSPPNPYVTARRVIIHATTRILGFRFHLSDSIRSYYSQIHGNVVQQQSWPASDLPEGEYIERIEAYLSSSVSWRLIGLRFYTNRNRISPLFGQSSNSRNILNLDGNLFGLSSLSDQQELFQITFLTAVPEYE